MISYTNWNREQKTWDPEAPNQLYFLVVDAYPTKPDGIVLRLEFGSVGLISNSAAEVLEKYAAALVKYPGFDWSASNARIMQAPCAFDARARGIFIQAVS